jgi:hypothetical protein
MELHQATSSTSRPGRGHSWAVVCGVCIGAVGTIGIFFPILLVWIAIAFVSAGALGFYLLAVVRVAFGLVLISAAASSRAPRAVRVLGCAIVVLGLITAISGLTAVAPGRDMIESWVQQGSGVIRLTAVPIVVLGSFVAYACAPMQSSRPT